MQIELELERERHCQLKIVRFCLEYKFELELYLNGGEKRVLQNAAQRFVEIEVECALCAVKKKNTRL